MKGEKESETGADYDRQNETDRQTTQEDNGKECREKVG